MRHKEFLNHLNNISQKKSLQETLKLVSEEGGSSTLAQRARPKIKYEAPPEPEVKPVETTVAQGPMDTDIPIDPQTGKRLDMFDKNDAEHNRRAAEYTQKKLLDKLKKGEITSAQLTNVRDQHAKKQEEIVGDIKLNDYARAIEDGADNVADVVGLVPGAGDLVDALHAGSYKIRGMMSDDPAEKARYDKLARDQVVYGLLLPAGIGHAAKGVAKVSDLGAKKASEYISKIPGKFGSASKTVIDTASSKIGKAVTNIVTDLNPVGMVGGGYAGMQAAPADADLGTKLMYGFGGAILGGKAVKYGNQIPGLGKVVADPQGSLPYYAGKAVGKAAQVTGKAVDATGKAIETGASKAIEAIPEPVKRTARAGVVGTAVALGTVPQTAGPVLAPAIKAVDGSGSYGTAPKRDLVPRETKPKISQSPETPKPKEEVIIRDDPSKTPSPARDITLSRQADRVRAEQKAQEEAKAKQKAEEEAKAKQEQKPESKPEAKPKGESGIGDTSGPNLLGKQELGNTPLYGYSSTNFVNATDPVFQRELRAQAKTTQPQRKQLAPILDRTDESYTNLKSLINLKINKILSEEELRGNMEPSISGSRSPQAARMQERSLSTMSTPETRKNRANAIQRMKDAIAAMNVETPKPTINPKYAGLPISAKSKKIPATKKILQKPS